MFPLCSILAVGQHSLDGGHIGLVGVNGLAEASLQLGGLLGQDVTAIGAVTLDFAVLGQFEALLGAGVSFQLGHCFILLNLRVRSAAGGSEYLSLWEFLSSFSVPALMLSRWLSTFARSLVPCCDYNIALFTGIVY